MIGDGQILHGQRVGRLGHLLHGMPAVRVDGMAVHHSADIFPADQIVGQCALQGGLDFAFVFPDLGWNQRKGQRPIHVRLVFYGKARGPRRAEQTGRLEPETALLR